MADWDICCDDSCKDGSRYLVYAGLMLPHDLIDGLSTACLPFGEIRKDCKARSNGQRRRR